MGGGAEGHQAELQLRASPLACRAKQASRVALGPGLKTGAIAQTGQGGAPVRPPTALRGYCVVPAYCDSRSAPLAVPVELTQQAADAVAAALHHLEASCLWTLAVGRSSTSRLPGSPCAAIRADRLFFIMHFNLLQ